MDPTTGVQDDPPKPIMHNQSFYFKDDPMAVFLVEHQLFKVHRHFLIEGSGVFRDMFAVAVPDVVGEATEGTCDEQPIPLPGVTVKEFETLLKFFYSPPYTNDEDTINKASAQERQEANLHLLSISHRFLFDDVFKYAVSQLRPLEIPVPERIRLGDKHRFQTWLFSAYEELLSRPESLKEEEANALGISRVVRFIQAKEDILRERLRIAEAALQAQSDCVLNAELGWKRTGFSPYPSHYQAPPNPTPAPVRTVVEKYFPEDIPT